MSEKKINEQQNTAQREISLEDLEKVTGGSLKNTVKKDTSDISENTQQNV